MNAPRTKRPTLLVPVDFGDPSRSALAQAKKLGEALGAEVVLLHVYARPKHGDAGMAAVLFPVLPDDAAASAERELAKQGLTEGVSRVIVREGEPADAILNAVAELAPVMVIMGSHGRSGLSRALLGSVAENVVRHATVPVLVVPDSVERGTRTMLSRSA